VNGLTLGMSEWLSPLWLMLGIDTIAAGVIVYAITRANEPVRTARAERDGQVPEIVVIEPHEWRNHSLLE
jgi:hypothetical protein